MTQTINVSPHVLMDTISCQTKAWVRHRKGFTSKGDAIKAVAGQAFHLALATLLEPRDGTCDESVDAAALSLQAFHTIYDPAYVRLSPEHLEPSLTPANLDRILRRWIQMHPPALLPWKRVLTVEEAFVSRSAMFGDTWVNLIVRPDMIVEDHAGKIRWVDTKTTGWHISDDSWKLALRMSLQTQLYSDAVVRKYGDAAIYGGWINAIELRTLPSDPNRKCQTHKTVYAECGNEHAKAEFLECLTTPEKVAASVDTAERAIEAFMRMLKVEKVADCDINGTANNTCRFCPAAQWCDTGRPDGEGALESFFIYEPWVVETGKRA